MKLLIVGHGRSGKDTALEYLAFVTNLTNAGTTSKYLAKYVAVELGIPGAEAYANRHESAEMRERWKRIGDKIRKDDPALLIKEALKFGDITGGVRDILEIQAARAENLVDLIIWVQNDRVPKDTTVTFTERDCDIIIPNNWSLQEFHDRLWRFANFAYLPMKLEYQPRLVDGKLVSRDLIDTWDDVPLYAMEQHGLKTKLTLVDATTGEPVNDRWSSIRKLA